MRKTGMVFFLVVTALMLVIPGIRTNVKTNQKSEMDNRMLHEFPAPGSDWFCKNVEYYLSDRVGFREGFITSYQFLSDKIFHKLEHPSYMYGKDGYVMVDWDLVTFQHRDVDESYVDNLTAYLKSLQSYCENSGAEFLFFLCPNKETIYPEYFPDGYNVKRQPNRTERITGMLAEQNVNYIYPKDLFMGLKKTEQLYNPKFDAGHWNDTGSFYGNQEIIKYLNQKFPEMGLLRDEEFTVGHRIEKYLMNSRFPINEPVPEYILKKTDMAPDNEGLNQIELTAPELYHMYYKHSESGYEKLPRILIFGDSYFEDAAKFYLNHCSELIMLHSNNLGQADGYIDYFQPDIVILEAVERVLQADGGLDDDKVEKRFHAN